MNLQTDCHSPLFYIIPVKNFCFGCQFMYWHGAAAVLSPMKEFAKLSDRMVGVKPTANKEEVKQGQKTMST